MVGCTNNGVLINNQTTLSKVDNICIIDLIDFIFPIRESLVLHCLLADKCIAQHCLLFQCCCLSRPTVKAFFYKMYLTFQYLFPPYAWLEWFIVFGLIIAAFMSTLKTTNKNKVHSAMLKFMSNNFLKYNRNVSGTIELATNCFVLSSYG